LAIAAFGAFPAAAQTCPTTPGTPTITAINHFERTLTLNSTLLSTISPNISADTLAGLNDGTLELREQINFSSASAVVYLTYFVVPAGSPVPTNLPQLPFSSLLSVSTLDICQILVVNKPLPSAMFFGTMGSGSLFGLVTGEPAVFSFGFTYDNPPVISNVSELVSGVVTAYSSSAAGSFTVFPLPGGGSPTGGGTINISINGPGGPSSTYTYTTLEGFATLDASASTSTNPGPLTFSWTVAPGSVPGITGGTTSPILQLYGLQHTHTYTFTLTVTDSTGLSASVTVSLTSI
jgi:hypothetical protein